MLLILENQKLSIDQLKERAFDPNNFSQNAKYVIEFIVSWLNGTQNFQFQTSGSTGKPKKILISREVLEYSARRTLDYIGWPTSDKETFLLCINPLFIGGSMVIVRALIANVNLVVVPPATIVPFSGSFSLASMVPLQIAQMSEQNSRFFAPSSTVLIGGGALSASVEKRLMGLSTTFYHTYGMTETASHVALRRLGERQYHAIGDATFSTDDDGALQIIGTITQNQWLGTSDVVRLVSATSFEWLGRKDFVINTGGVKVQPESVEELLAPQIPHKFIISSIPDPVLGQKVVLISEGESQDLDFEALHPYERPKECFFLQEIALTASGKVDRRTTYEKLLKTIAT